MDTSNSLARRVSTELLGRVNQPGQYIAGEINQRVRPGDWNRADVRVALAFPDTYAIGMSHLGGQILYEVCNNLTGVCAERVFCPWTDAEHVMRSRGIPLFTWDTRQPVGSADLLGFSLQVELCAATVLNMLDLAGIPLRAEQRGPSDPLVLAGGPVADNLEPFAPFFDLAVIGDGEEALPVLLSAYRDLRLGGASRDEIVTALARRFDWIYAPGLYDVRYHADGRIAAVTPNVPGLPERIRRCVVDDFEHAPVPERPLVPNVETVHDRISIEVMRGCPHLCRFCHAGHTKRPARARSVDRICEIAEAGYRATGKDEIGLLSLSTADYPELRELVRRLSEQFNDRQVSLSVPSLRVDQMLSDIPAMVSGVRKGGLTIAVEAARDRLRRAIGKPITDEKLLAGVRAAYEAGWRTVKLYFMVGFPGETADDVDGIWQLAHRISSLRREIGQGRATVNTTVSWLVPKAHTSLQWAPMATKEYCFEARGRLKDLSGTRRTGVRWKFHHVERSILEGVLARGDRRLSDVIEAAWRAGARLDAWNEQFDMLRWDQAFHQIGIDPAWYVHRERAFDEILPWDHIDACLRREHLWRGYRRVLEHASPTSPASPDLETLASGPYDADPTP
ncbi:MAG: TIGR03960 family B12-binding radical SAM protein [Phycisphaerae bacterium]|nr:TIGR03960 family B12-binding radical SAM protein [Phycisphaerae bacterium]